MIFSHFKKYVPPADTVETYLRDIFDKILSELSFGLTQLTFKDNIAGFYQNVTINAGFTAAIENKLDVIPTGFITVRQVGVGQLTETTIGSWTNDKLYIKNNGSVTITATLFFMR